MKKFLIFLLAAAMLLSFTSCVTIGGEPAGTDTPDTVQDEPVGGGNTAAPDTEDTVQTEEVIPTEGTPLGWPENDYTKLGPTPTCGGKVMSSGEIGNLFAVEVKWTMEQGLVYAQQLADAGFGDDCVEKYEKYGYIDRTANGVNVQLLDVFGMASVSIMPSAE